MQWRIFAVRTALGVFFAIFLAKFFMPGAPAGVIPIMAVVLVFFAYVFEALRRR